MTKILDRSLGKLAEAAFRRMAEKVIERAKASGTPLVLWENGKVKEIDPSEWAKGKGKAVRK